MRFRVRALLMLQLAVAVYLSAYVASATPKFVATHNGQAWDIVASPDYPGVDAHLYYCFGQRRS